MKAPTVTMHGQTARLKFADKSAIWAVRFASPSQWFAGLDRKKWFKDCAADPSWHAAPWPSLDAAADALIAGRPHKSQRAEYERTLRQLMADPEIMQPLQSVKRHRVVHDDGEDVSVDRLLSGGDRCLSGMRRGKPIRTIRLGVNISVNCNVASADISRIGSVMTAACKLLSAAGYPVECFVATPSLKFGGDGEIKVGEILSTVTRLPLPLSRGAEDAMLSATSGAAFRMAGLELTWRRHFFGESGSRTRAIANLEEEWGSELSCLGPEHWVSPVSDKDAARIAVRHVIARATA